MAVKTKINDMKNDISYEMHLMVVKLVDRGLTVKGTPYTAADLMDGEKKITVNFFDYTPEMLKTEGVDVGTILTLKLTRTEREGGSGFFYNQSDWKICDDSAVTKSDFVHMAPIDLEQEMEELLFNVGLLTSIEYFGDDEIKGIADLTHSLLKEHREEFMRSSAAESMHHNYLGGLLYHTSRMVEMAEQACKVYPDLDKELLMCGAALHDIGKIVCYDTTNMGETSVTVTGRLLDHSVEGILMIERAAQNTDIDPERVRLLQHLIASHHGKSEWGAVTTPAIPEAEMLHQIDMMDSRKNMFEEAYKGQVEGTLSDQRIYGLENGYIYKSPYYVEEPA
jgi:3'-5' exoribonuclease